MVTRALPADVEAAFASDPDAPLAPDVRDLDDFARCGPRYLRLVRRLALCQRRWKTGELVDTLAVVFDVSQLPPAWAAVDEHRAIVPILMHLLDLVHDLLVRMGVGIKTYLARGAYLELCIARASAPRVKRLVARHAEFIGARPAFLRDIDPAWQPYADDGVRAFEAAMRGPT